MTQFPNALDPMKQVETKVKTALTRTYNKLVIKRSYNIEQKVVKGKKAKKEGNDDMNGSGGEDDQSDQNDRYNYDLLSKVVHHVKFDLFSDVDISAFAKKSKPKKPTKAKKKK